MPSFLKKLGQIGATVGKLILGQALGAVDKSVQVPVSGDTLVGVFQEIIKAELVQFVDANGAPVTLTGAQKSAIAAAAVEQIILRSPIAANRKLTDPVKFRADVLGLVGKCADIFNDFHQDDVHTADVGA